MVQGKFSSEKVPEALCSHEGENNPSSSIQILSFVGFLKLYVQPNTDRPRKGKTAVSIIFLRHLNQNFGVTTSCTATPKIPIISFKHLEGISFELQLVLHLLCDTGVSVKTEKLFL